MLFAVCRTSNCQLLLQKIFLWDCDANVFLTGPCTGCQCDEITYTSVMEAYTRNYQPLLAESMMGEMKRAGIQPGPVSYGVLINGYCQAGRLGDAERILR